jgi:hypothetical protein
MKKKYIEPAMQVVKMKYTPSVLFQVSGGDGNVSGGGPGSGGGKSRQYNGWKEEDEEDDEDF